MSRFIDYAIDHARLTIATLIFLLGAGLVAYVTIPKEAEPDIKIPIIYVQLSQRGISPEDSERLLLRPVETQLKSVGNVKEMRSTAFEGGGFVLLEFEAGFDSKSALADVRAKVDQAKHDLPRDVDEPQVLEVNLSLYPVLVVGLSGDVPERTLLRIARSAKNAIEQAPGVLAAELRGARDEAVEIILDPKLLASYGMSLDQLGSVTQSFNTLIAAGAIEGETGRFAVKVPSLFEKPQDILKIPIIASSKASVTLLDIGEVKPTFKDATSVTRVNGRPAMTIEVSKRSGANLIETVDAVRATVAELQKTWPEAVHVTFTQDKSKVIRQMLGDLQNSVATGVLLVVIVILFALGFRASLFIGIAIPASFLAGVLGLQLAGLTVNIVVLFSLILAVGMLVDDAIIVSEFAERRMSEGMPPQGGVFAGGQADGRPGDRRHRDPHRRVLAAAVLAGRGRPVHEISADHTDRDALGLAGGGAVLYPHARCAARQGVAGTARRPRTRQRTLYAHGAAGVAPARHDAHAGGAASGRGAGGLRKVRPRRRILPERRARLRPGDRARARQPRARGEESPRCRGREASARVRRPQDRLYPHRRAAARHGRADRRYRRGYPVRVRGLASRVRPRTRSWMPSAPRPRTCPAS